MIIPADADGMADDEHVHELLESDIANSEDYAAGTSTSSAAAARASRWSKPSAHLPAVVACD